MHEMDPRRNSVTPYLCQCFPQKHPHHRFILIEDDLPSGRQYPIPVDYHYWGSFSSLTKGMEVQCKRFSGNGLSTDIPECDGRQGVRVECPANYSGMAAIGRLRPLATGNNRPEADIRPNLY